MAAVYVIIALQAHGQAMDCSLAVPSWPLDAFHSARLLAATRGLPNGVGLAEAVFYGGVGFL